MNKFSCVLTFIVLYFIVTYTMGMPQLKIILWLCIVWSTPLLLKVKWLSKRLIYFFKARDKGSSFFFQQLDMSKFQSPYRISYSTGQFYPWNCPSILTSIQQSTVWFLSNDPTYCITEWIVMKEPRNSSP